MAEVIKLKLTDNQIVGVIFVESLERSLREIRSQMREEIDELIPNAFRFMSKCGAPLSNIQKQKISVQDALDDGMLTIQPIHDESTTTTSTSPATANQPESTTSSLWDEDEPITISSQKMEKCVRRKRCISSNSGAATTQTTLTKYFGASSSPKQKYATATTRKGVHVYTESEIHESVGHEKERRLFWNEKAEELCRLQKYPDYNADEIDKLLHERWKINKAEHLKQEQ